MSGSSIGTLFRVTTAGESHGPAEVVIVDGCPAGLALTVDDIARDLARRRPGQSHLTTQRREADVPELLSGVHEGRTTGAPIAVMVRNEDAKSRDYDAIASLYRPGHADYTYDAKYGHRDPRGGGRASARETVARVAAGAVARTFLRAACGIEILGYVVSIADVDASVDPLDVEARDIDWLDDETPNLVRCPDRVAQPRMIEAIEAARRDLDSVGGVAEVVARGVPRGLGEPVFDKLRADLGKALLSIPAVLGVEFGSGFAGARMRGSAHNDRFTTVDRTTSPPTLATSTQHHGGTLGGITTGMPLLMRAAVKPPSSIAQPQPMIDRAGDTHEAPVRGRHDPCVLPRFVPIAEAMVAIVLADHVLRHRASRLDG